MSALSLLNRDISRIDDWCKRWDILINYIKTTVLGVVLDTKLSFESHIRLIAALCQLILEL